LLPDTFGAILVEQVALFKRLLNCFLQILERVLIPLAELHVRVLEPALEKKVGEGFEQIFADYSLFDDWYVQKKLLMSLP